MTVELLYYRKRLDDETAGAATAETPMVRQIHLEFARCYEQRIKALEDARGEIPLQLVCVAQLGRRITAIPDKQR